MKTFTEYISENSILDEASVNRFWQHLTKDSIIGMITADRAFLSKEDFVRYVPMASREFTTVDY